MSNIDAPAPFAGFTTETVPWFEGLTADNSRDYFLENRPIYERAVRGPLLSMVTDLADRFGGTVKLFRPNRDVRFSADKQPYKTNSSALLLDHRPGSGALLYVSVSADGIHAATGYYQMAKDQLARFRRVLTAADDSARLGAELRQIVESLRSSHMEVEGMPLKGMPRGVPKDAPNADLARFTWLVAGDYLEPERICDRTALDWVAGVWTKTEPLNEWLDRHIGESGLPATAAGKSRG